MKKLVRDKIIEIIKSNGDFCEYYIANGDDLFLWTKNKLIEESNEVLESKNIDEFKEEMADLLEVFYALLKQKGINLKEIEKVRVEKNKKRGSFNKGIILTNLIKKY